jgi:hypothetical protein
MANLIFPQSPFLDQTGRPAREWVQWLQNPDVQTITAVTFTVDNVILTLPLKPEFGGTGITQIPAAGQLLIGNGTDYTLNTLTAGTGLTITSVAGSITPRITNTGVSAGAYGSASSVTTLTVNAQGQLTVVGSVAIAIAASQITSGILSVARGGTGLATLTANRIPYGNGTAAYQSSANLTYDGSIFTVKADIVVNKTITASGTTGAQTIDKTSGSVNFAIAATSLVVTNSLVTTSSIILATVASNDTTMKSVQAVAAAGSFTLYANAAATAETRVNFLVLN